MEMGPFLRGVIFTVCVIVYTRWRNLHKTNDMEVGAIGFHDRTKVKRMKVEKDNTIVNRINKTKEVLFVFSLPDTNTAFYYATSSPFLNLPISSLDPISKPSRTSRAARC